MQLFRSLEKLLGKQCDLCNVKIKQGYRKYIDDSGKEIKYAYYAWSMQREEHIGKSNCKNL